MNLQVKDECNLENLLSHLNVEQLKNIRRNLQLKNMSSLRKKELIVALTEKIPESVNTIAQMLDVDQYSVVLKLMAKSGVMEIENFQMEDVFYLSSIGYTHPTQQEDKDVLVMPNEVLTSFYKLDASQMKITVNRNQKVSNLLFAMVRYYGVISLNDAKRIIEKYIGEELDNKWLNNYVVHLENYYGSFYMKDKMIVNELVENVEELIEAQKAKGELPYFAFSPDVMFNINREKHFDQNLPTQEMIAYVQKNYDIPLEGIEEMIEQCILMAQSEKTLNEIVTFVSKYIQFQDIKEVQKFVGKLVSVMNNSRLWVLKGFTPYELSPQSRETTSEPKQTVKVGRNEPCPCESGKKYKKCCME